MITAFLRHLRGFPVLRRLKHSLKMRAYPVHPVDVEYGIKTSAPLWAYLMQSGIPSVDMANNGYLGSQPSAIRHALSQTGDISEATFIDIGSGKGRALAVATEFPFRRIMGLEISKELCRLARSNAQIIERKFPARTKIEIIEGNAIDPPLAPGLSVIFFFNSFGPDLTSQLLSNIERRLRADDRIKVFFLYYNPLHYDLFDASKQFHRYAAENYAITTEASGSSRFQDEDGPQSVVTYQSRHADMVPQRSGAGRPVRISKPYNAEIVLETV